MTQSHNTRCGFVAIIGRPNVGKSTLLNHLLGMKLAITSRKAQTTRQRLLGIKTRDDVQIIYVDTPGLHLDAKRAMNREMNRQARYALRDVDVVIFLVDATRWTQEDDYVVKLLSNIEIPLIIALNKIDLVSDKSVLLPRLNELQQRLPHASSIIPISARQNFQLSQLEDAAIEKLPESPFFFAEDDITDKQDRFIVAEFIREKLYHTTGEEIPYFATVEIEKYEMVDGVMRIAALIYVEREGQKKIVIGKKGEKLKEIGTSARLDIEHYLECKVYLQLWVKVRSGWSDDERALRSLGLLD